MRHVSRLQKLTINLCPTSKEPALLPSECDKLRTSQTVSCACRCEGRLFEKASRTTRTLKFRTSRGGHIFCSTIKSVTRRETLTRIQTCSSCSTSSPADSRSLKAFSRMYLASHPASLAVTLAMILAAFDASSRSSYRLSMWLGADSKWS
jgi:hypothetical protein